ncbi:MAG: hypothetical protein JNM88_18915, partial [Chitinophagaceae bacterium]|nr:hypothetical protein [Chitinophagaceae bacterium]
MKKMISSKPTEDVLVKMNAAADESINHFESHAVSLSDKERVGLRTMGNGRQGIVRSMSGIALSFEECLPRTENATDLHQMLDYHISLNDLFIKVGKLYEMLRDTVSATGVDAIKTFDRYNNYFQTARNNNSALDLALQP